jgi:hypothetical protein
MSEPVESVKPVILVVWIALITAIIVTVIDWKIKTDILKLAQDFYSRYPEKMVPQEPVVKENSNAGRFNQRSEVANSQNSGPVSLSRVLRVPVVDNDTGMEAQNPTASARQVSEDHSRAWSEFGISTPLDTGSDEDSGSIPSRPFDVQGPAE